MRIAKPLNRREFLQTSSRAGAGLLLTFHLPGRPAAFGESSNSFAPNAWLEIAPDGAIKIWCAKSEVGQGVRTALPMIVAEELCCDWRRVQVVQADLDPKYGDQLTGGSLSVRTSYESLRKAGTMAGSGGIVVLTEDVSIVDMTLNVSIRSSEPF